MATLSGHLSEHRFAELFLDDLGWDRSSGEIHVEVDERDLSFLMIAQKRGFQVLHCTADRRILMNRGLLRRAQRQIASSVHEHILIFSCCEPPKQVWQWAVRLPDGRRLRHREHPFVSSSPPDPFLARLIQLRFSRDEESDVTLVDALDRVRQALDVSADFNLFVKRPRLAERSDELAVAMQRGDKSAFHPFVELHISLARKISRRLERWFDMLPDDAGQIAMIGLMRAAHRFQPQRGCQFSTYATWWILQACRHDGPAAALMIHVPDYVFWDCYGRRIDVERLWATAGPSSVRDWLSDFEIEDPKWASRWRNFVRATSVTSLSHRCDPEYWEARSIAETIQPPDDTMIRLQEAALVQKAIGRLHLRQATILRLRYGIGCEKHTLKQIGALTQVTRERVRQIQSRAEERLQWLLRSEAPAGWERGGTGTAVIAMEQGDDSTGDEVVAEPGDREDAEDSRTDIQRRSG